MRLGPGNVTSHRLPRTSATSPNRQTMRYRPRASPAATAGHHARLIRVAREIACIDEILDAVGPVDRRARPLRGDRREPFVVRCQRCGLRNAAERTARVGEIVVVRVQVMQRMHWIEGDQEKRRRERPRLACASGDAIAGPARQRRDAGNRSRRAATESRGRHNDRPFARRIPSSRAGRSRAPGSASSDHNERSGRKASGTSASST